MEDRLQDLVGLTLRWSYDRRIIQESSAKDQALKAVSEMGELCDAILKKNRDEAVDALGDVLVCLINASEIMGITMEESLKAAYDQIKDRKGVMYQGVFIKESDVNYERVAKILNIEV